MALVATNKELRFEIHLYSLVAQFVKNVLLIVKAQ